MLSKYIEWVTENVFFLPYKPYDWLTHRIRNENVAICLALFYTPIAFPLVVATIPLTGLLFILGTIMIVPMSVATGCVKGALRLCSRYGDILV